MSREDKELVTKCKHCMLYLSLTMFIVFYFLLFCSVIFGEIQEAETRAILVALYIGLFAGCVTIWVFTIWYYYKYRDRKGGIKYENIKSTE